MNSFEKNVAVYEQELEDLLVENEGKFILVRDGEIVNIYDSHEEAMRVGYEKYQLTGFLVKEVLRSDYEILHPETCQN